MKLSIKKLKENKGIAIFFMMLIWIVSTINVKALKLTFSWNYSNLMLGIIGSIIVSIIWSVKFEDMDENRR